MSDSSSSGTFQAPSGRGGRMRVVWIVGAVLLILIVIAVLSLGSRPAGYNTSPTPTANGAGVSDSTSPTPTPEDPKKAPTVKTAYTGLGTLTTNGFTTDQIDAMKFGFTKYAKQSGTAISTVDIRTTTVKFQGLKPTAQPVTFDAVVNGSTTYHVNLVLTGPTSLTMTLMNLQGAPVFQSGPIDLYNGIGD